MAAMPMVEAHAAAPETAAPNVHTAHMTATAAAHMTATAAAHVAPAATAMAAASSASDR
jgi:hypothetical protein